MIEPTWKSGDVTLYLGDCLDILPTLEAGSVNLIFADPPYNIGIFSKMDPADYLAWCERWIAACDRVLAPNGAFWVSHKDPDVLVEISRIIDRTGRRRVNWVTWDKWNDLRFRWERGESLYPPFGALWRHVCRDALRSFGSCAEYLIYHADEGDWARQCDREHGFIFEPLRAYLEGERDRAGLTTQDVAESWRVKTGNHRRTGMAGHWFSRVQWSLPTEDNYHWLRDYFHSLNGGGDYLRREYEDLRREYEDLRREYEDLRYTFNNPGKMSSVWQIPPAPKSWHPTPKPPQLLERIIKATSNEGDLVLDPFLGSGTTGKEAQRLGRRFIGMEIEPDHYERARQDIAQMQPRLEGI